MRMPQTVPTVGFNTLDPGDSSTTSYSMADLDLSILAESSYSFQVPSPSHSFPDSAGSPPTLYHSPSPEAGKGFPTQYPPSPEAMDDLDQFVKYSSQMLLSDQPICDTYQRKPSSPPSQPQSPLQDQQADHQLLRQFLNDKSYLQNVKAEPYYDSLSEMLTTNIKQENGSAPTCCGGNNHNNSNGGEPDVCGDVKIEPFLALALDQISQEIELACKTLDISPGEKGKTREVKGKSAMMADHASSSSVNSPSKKSQVVWSESTRRVRDGPKNAPEAFPFPRERTREGKTQPRDSWNSPFPNPKEWLVGDVKKWVMWTVGQYSLPYVNVDNFQLDGLALLNLTEEAFMRLAPQCGDALMATLDLWSTAEIRMRRSARGMSGQGQGQDGSTPFDLASLASWSSAEGSSSLSPRSLHDRDDSDGKIAFQSSWDQRASFTSRHANFHLV
ncbi:unnamed protein product [Darwinula stevensoni]|uniref:PNT domain-containing protein n=1 Tax=Darwinula stevensoni TaxID=69355 RepID=A0A7R9ACF1_9CRUS|nr:unnamed protein product [Darwinula stevensoni]CAG0899750.1 unnamed protein product [Darwinula stevensoni]